MASITTTIARTDHPNQRLRGLLSLREAASREHRSLASRVEVLIRDHCRRNGIAIAVVPQPWPLEVANVLLAATRAGRIQARDWPRIHADLQALPIHVDPETHERAFQSALPLAHRHELSVYDAVYLEPAQRLELPLATLDKKLRSACRGAGVKTI